MAIKLNPYKAYKPVELNFTKQIPLDWIVKRGKFFFKEISIRSKKGEEQLLSVSEHKGIVPRDTINVTMFQALSYEGYKLCNKGDIVINSLWAWHGGLGVSEFHGIVSTAYGVYRPLRPELWNHRYLNYLLRDKTYVGECLIRSKGIWESRYQLTGSNFLDIPILQPPLSVQNDIVAYLDKKNNEIDKFIRNKERLIELLKLEKDTITKELVTRGIDENVSFKKTDIYWIKEIPNHWEIKPFKIAFKENKRRNDFKEVYPVLSLSYGNVIFKDHDSNMGLVPMNYDSYQIINPDMLVFRFTDLQNDHKSLRVGLAKNKGIITSAYLAVIKQSKVKLSTDYAYLLLHSYDIDKVFYQFGGGVRQAIGFPDVKQLPILLPPIEEQNKIVAEQIEQTNKINNLISKAEKELSSIKEYREALITDLVTGKRSVQQLQKC